MLQFYAAYFVAAIVELQRIHYENALHGNDEECKERLGSILRDFKPTLEGLKIPFAGDDIDHILHILNSDVSYLSILPIVNSLERKVHQELTRHLFLEISSEYRVFYENIMLSDQAKSQFPSLINEIDEAGKCFALERNTACVFHLMRALEIALGSMATALHVEFDNRNWQNILNDLEKKVRSMNKKWGSDWKEMQQFFSEAAVQFHHLKNAWRNHTMHAKQTYDRKQAANIFNAVREFINHLATRLSE